MIPTRTELTRGPPPPSTTGSLEWAPLRPTPADLARHVHDVVAERNLPAIHLPLLVLIGWLHRRTLRHRRVMLPATTGPRPR